MKKCSRCKVEKDVKAFNKDSRNKNGLREQCKKCVAKYYEEHKEERAASNKQYREEHKEEISASKKQWYEEHKEEQAARCKQWYEENKEDAIVRSKQYHEEHREECVAKMRHYYETHKEERIVYLEENKDEIAAYKKQWKKDHPDEVKVSNQNRRARKMGNGGTHSVQEWIGLKEKFNYTCLCCGKKEPDIKLTEDHIIPLIVGGLNSIDNIQPLCRSCNCKKHDKIIDYRNESKIEQERIKD